MSCSVHGFFSMAISTSCCCCFLDIASKPRQQTEIQPFHMVAPAVPPDQTSAQNTPAAEPSDFSPPTTQPKPTNVSELFTFVDPYV